MLRTALVLLSLAAGITLAGCGGGSQKWELSVENKSDAPCSFSVVFGPEGSAKAAIQDVAKGESHSLIEGDATTRVQSISVTSGKGKVDLTPDIELPVGNRCHIVYGADRKIQITLTDR